MILLEMIKYPRIIFRIRIIQMYKTTEKRRVYKNYSDHFYSKH